MTDVSPATREMAGRTCPYCRFGLEEGVGVVACPECKAVHHGDCWEENDGCAVALCAGGPSREQGAAATEETRPAEPEPEPEPLPPATPPPPPVTVVEKTSLPPLPGEPSPQRRSRPAWAPLVAVTICLLGGAAAALIVLARDDAGSAETTVETSNGGDEFDDEFIEDEDFYEPEPPPPTPEQRARRQVQSALQAHFERLVDGSYESAYYDLTPGERNKIGSESGWVDAHAEDQLQSFDLTVNTSLQGSNSADARIVEFRTRALASGCKDWHGHWEMKKIYGEWLIDAAELEDAPC